VREAFPWRLCPHSSRSRSTFTPHIAAAVPPRPVTSDDLARDAVLAQRIALFRGWLLPRHLDLPEADPPSSSEDGGGAGGDESAGGFLLFAEQGAAARPGLCVYAHA
jgi:hypothetical protein